MKRVKPLLFTLSVLFFASGALQAQIWTEDFASGIGNWTVMDMSTLSSGDAWIYSTTGPQGQFSIGPMVSTSAANGYALFDSDLLCSGSQNSWLISPPIDLTNETAAILSFENYYAEFNSDVFLQVSNDGGATWTAFQLYGGLVNNQASLNPDIVEIDISSIVAGSAQAHVAFQFLADDPPNDPASTGCGYAWMVDDISISAELIPEVALVRSEVPLYQIPIGQIDPAGYNISALVNSFGTGDVENAVLSVDILDESGTSVYSGASATSTIPAGNVEEVSAGTWNPPAMEMDYTMVYTLSGDGVDDQTLERAFSVTEVTYALDSDVFAGGLGVNGLGVIIDQGQTYPINADGEITSLSAFVAGGTTGDPMEIRFYEVNADTVSSTILYQEDIVLPQAAPGWWDIKLETPFAVTAGQEIMISLRHSPTVDGGNIILGYASDYFNPGNAWFQVNNGGWANPEVQNFFLSYMMRPNFGESTNDVTFTVEMTNETVGSGGVSMAWAFANDPGNPNIVPMTNAGDSLWTATISLNSCDTIGYFFINGDGTDPATFETVPGECGLDAGGGLTIRPYIARFADEEIPAVCFSDCELCPPPPAPACTDPAAIVCDDFDGYDLGAITPQSPLWEIWPAAGVTDANVVDDIVFSAPNSLFLSENNTDDVIVLLGNQTEGKYLLTWKMYIPAGFVGYYNIQEDEVAGTAWNLQVGFGIDGGFNNATPGTGIVFETGANFTYPEDTWMTVSHVIDLDNNTNRVLLDGQLLAEYEYVGNVGAVNFYSVTDMNRFYVDDFLFKSLPSCPDDAIICDGMEVYPAGPIAEQAPWWRTWSGTPSADEDGIVVDSISFDGTNSMAFVGGGSQDVLFDFGNQTTGSYILQWKQYVPSGRAGYHNLQKDVDNPGASFGNQVFFLTDGTGEIDANGTDAVATFTYTQDEWIDVVYALDIDANRAWLGVEGQTVFEWDITETALDPADGLQQYGALNLFPIDGDYLFFVDAIRFREMPACGADAIICDPMERYLEASAVGPQASWWTTYDGDSEQEAIASTAFANNGRQSVVIDGETDVDAVVALGNRTSGNYEVRWMQYVPSGAGAYHSIEKDESSFGASVACEVDFGTDGNGVVAAEDVETNFTYPQDDWFMVRYTVDADNDMVEMFVDGDAVVSFPLSAVFDGNDGLVQLGGINFFPLDTDYLFYVDDFYFTELPPIQPLVNVTLTVDMAMIIQMNGDVSADGVHVAGEFNGWNPSATMMTPNGDDTYSATVMMSQNDTVEYKFINGNTFGPGIDETVPMECGIGGNPAFNRFVEVGDMDMAVDPVCFSFCVACIDVSTEEAEFESRLELFPNPTSGLTRLGFNFEQPEALQVRISNSLGQLIQTQQIGDALTGTVELNVSNLPSGMYFVQISNGSVQTTKRLMVE